MKKIKIILIALACFVCVGLVFGYIYIEKKSTEESSPTVMYETDMEQESFSKASMIESIVSAITKRKPDSIGYMNTAGWRTYTLNTSQESIIYPPTWTLSQRTGWEEETIFDRMEQESQGNALTTLTPPTPLSTSDTILIGDGATVNCSRADEKAFSGTTRIFCAFDTMFYTRSTNPLTLKVFDTIKTYTQKNR